MADTTISITPGTGADVAVLTASSRSYQATVQRGFREAGTLHRNAITVPDVLATPAQPGAFSGQTGGSLVSATSYNLAVIARNTYGHTVPGTVRAGTPGGSNTAIRSSIAQVTNAVSYDLFFSTDTPPLWVGTITESQRAAGGLITAVGTYSAGGVAGSIDFRVVGTGVASSAYNTATNFALVPLGSGIDCSGFRLAHIMVQLAADDLRSQPTCLITPMLLNQTPSPNVWHAAAYVGISAPPWRQEWWVTCDGAKGLQVLFQSITGQNAAVSCWVELL
jgi:hypothetical protein